MSGDVLSVAFGWVYRFTLGLFLILLATGVGLWFYFRPVILPPTGLDGLPIDVVLGYRLNQVHRVASVAFLVSATLCGVLAVLQRAENFSLRVLLGVALGAATLGGVISGQALPWQQLAIRGARNVRGYTWLLGDDVVFITLGDRIVSSNYLWTWLLLHLVVVTGATAVCLVGLRPGRNAAREVSVGSSLGAHWDLDYVPTAPPEQ